MRLSDFHYFLPEELIAQYPLKKRTDSRLMVLHRNDQTIEDRRFRDILEYLHPGDCLVVNETRVFPARLIAQKERSDSEIEVFLLRELEPDLWEVLVRPARKVRIGNKLHVGNALAIEVVDNTLSGGRIVRFHHNEKDLNALIDHLGLIPLPPYIRRDPGPIDRERYQSVFAKKRGAVAAPTASLHFDKRILKKIQGGGTRIVPVLLHIGLGTFRPIQVEEIHHHKMDAEYYEVSPESAEIINRTREAGGRVVAVGTTVVRVLETVVDPQGHVRAESGWTEKFIYPPYEFKAIDALFTNFHMPCSTLLMLVCAFAGREFVLKAYRRAVQERYRFLSYGDAMLIL